MDNTPEGLDHSPGRRGSGIAQHGASALTEVSELGSFVIERWRDIGFG
jgi:hypothetical protein